MMLNSSVFLNLLSSDGAILIVPNVYGFSACRSGASSVCRTSILAAVITLLVVSSPSSEGTVSSCFSTPIFGEAVAPAAAFSFTAT